MSDYLGHMWRKGLVVRLPAPKDSTSRSRWMYVWKPKAKAPRPTLEDAVLAGTMNTILKRPNVEITEEGKNVVITLPGLSITIRQT